jgi:hypothetical protein
LSDPPANTGFMRLVIEHVGIELRRGELVSVAHYGEKNSDMTRDPEIVFEVMVGEWHPVSIQMDYTDHYGELVAVGEDGKGYVHLPLVHDFTTISRVWDRNLNHQGFIDAAKNRDDC